MFKKTMIICIVGLLFIPLTGCSSDSKKSAENPSEIRKDKPSKEAGFVGYVVSRDERGRILVISPIKKNLGKENREFYDEIWFSNAPGSIKVGQKVKIDIKRNAIKESKPAQAAAEKVTVIPSVRKENTTLKEYEAVSRALRQQATDLQVVSKVDYQKNTDEWHITIRIPPRVQGEWEYNEKMIIIKDS